VSRDKSEEPRVFSIDAEDPRKFTVGRDPFTDGWNIGVVPAVVQQRARWNCARDNSMTFKQQLHLNSDAIEVHKPLWYLVFGQC
jgi:hypothetical protein